MVNQKNKQISKQGCFSLKIFKKKKKKIPVTLTLGEISKRISVIFFPVNL